MVTGPHLQGILDPLESAVPAVRGHRQYQMREPR